MLLNAVENDIEHKLDMSVIEGMAELGLLGIVIPRSTAAPDSTSSRRRSCEEIERGEAAFRTLISVHVGLNSLSAPVRERGAEAALPRSPGARREACLA